ncbi:uncharacterized protein LOC135373366 [Ornithodoros turicata]|uniref:uncharacterized protein LOC135373366 n=1 Tax=Ornithodoros turicata TaxID=34597 RepID=UPI0031386503
MELRKWCSSSETLNEQFRADGVSLDDIGQPLVRCKVLGLPWNRSADTIVMTTQNVSSYVATQPATKRLVLQTFARLFDPLGLLGPFLVRAKLLFQELWRRNCTWEEALPEDVHEHWKTWTSELSELSSFEVPRCVISPATQGAKGQELHVFCDASPMAYGVAVYVRCVMSENSFASQLLMSKGRIAPLRPVSIPRLELLACLLAARLCHYVRQLPELSQAVVHLWTDSAVALHWICGDAVRQEVFVRNRSSEIRRLTRGFHWHHCRSQDNPADLLTRGEPASFVSRKTIWWAGPAWLTNPQVDWPTDLCPSQKHDDLRTGLTSACQSLSLPTSPHLHDPLLRINDYGRLTKVLRVTAWIKRFLRNASLHTTSSSGPLTAAELCEAELYWIRFVQRSAFPSEVATLEVGQPVESASSILTLQPFLDKKGLLRVGGRLQALDASEELKHPMILPCNDRFTELLVEAAHIRLLHGGVQLTLIELRSRFWILKGRRTVRRVLNACLPCRRRRLRPETAPPAPLPRDRITETMPFDVVGIDFCGPLYCRASQNTDRKVYIVVFSCAVTRAIHLELTIDMTAQTFLLAFRRFASRRGVPSTIYSDNAKTFRYCAKVLRALFDDSVQDHASSLRIQWKFIAEGAPWWGGFWERLIRTIKDALKRCLGRSSLCYEGLLTVLLEVEAAVNCRPLTQLADDTEDCEALTPSHFLIGRRAVALPASLGLEVPRSTPAGLRRRVRHRQALLVQLWTRWKKDYLLLLRSAHHSQPRAHPRIRVGDVVIVEDNALPPLQRYVTPDASGPAAIQHDEGPDAESTTPPQPVSGDSPARSADRLYDPFLAALQELSDRLPMNHEATPALRAILAFAFVGEPFDDLLEDFLRQFFELPPRRPVAKAGPPRHRPPVLGRRARRRREHARVQTLYYKDRRACAHQILDGRAELPPREDRTFLGYWVSIFTSPSPPPLDLAEPGPQLAGVWVPVTCEDVMAALPDGLIHRSTAAPVQPRGPGDSL